MLAGLLVFLASGLLADGCQQGCQFIPSNAMSLVQQYINFSDAPLMIGDGPNMFKWLNCPCFTGVFEGGVLQTEASDAGLLLSNQAFSVPTRGELQLSSTFRFSGRLNSCNTTEIINANENPFYGYATMAAVDTVTGWSFGFILTNYRVFALYGRNPRSSAPYRTEDTFPFTYLIPIAPRWPGALYTYSLVLNGAAGTVSYRIGDKEKLVLDQVGQSVDRKFLVQTGVPNPRSCPADSFPEFVNVLLGNGRLVSTGPGNEHVCQLALFNQCKESIRSACRVDCKYGDIPQEPFNKTVALTSVFFDMSVVQWYDSYNCREQTCRLDCRIPACPFEGVSDDTCPPGQNDNSHDHDHENENDHQHHPQRRHRSNPHVIDTEEVYGTFFSFDSDWRDVKAAAAN